MARKKRISLGRYVLLRLRESSGYYGKERVAESIGVSDRTIERWTKQRTLKTKQIEKATRALPDFVLRDLLESKVDEWGLTQAARFGKVPPSTLSGWVHRISIPLGSLDYAQRVYDDILANEKKEIPQPYFWSVALLAFASGDQAVVDAGFDRGGLDEVARRVVRADPVPRNFEGADLSKIRQYSYAEYKASGLRGVQDLGDAYFKNFKDAETKEGERNLSLVWLRESRALLHHHAYVYVPFVAGEKFDEAHRKSTRGGDAANLTTSDLAAVWSLVDYMINIGAGADYFVIVYKPIDTNPAVFKIEIVELQDEFRSNHPGYYNKFDAVPTIGDESEG